MRAAVLVDGGQPGRPGVRCVRLRRQPGIKHPGGGRPLDWVQIGAVAGATIELPSAALRSANLRLQGSGQGAVGTAGYLAELPPLISEISAGRITVTTSTVPLAEVEQAWTCPETPGERTVLVP